MSSQVDLPASRATPAPQLHCTLTSFIETQFPISRLSRESYKERKSNYSQTLTGLGKWWGRKPLILCRATLLGLLMPASDDPVRDREIFLKILTMDPDGLLRRWKNKYTVAELALLTTPGERREWEALDRQREDAAEQWRVLCAAAKAIPRTARDARDRALAETMAAAANMGCISVALVRYLDTLQRAVFLRQPYEEQIARCDRPEQIKGPSLEAWAEINHHLGTSAASLAELVQELGQRRFGRVPRVGDAFCGGGSIPFEAARMGCEAYASDLNPVAALLTWAALHIVGGGPEVAERVRAAQQEIYDAVDRQVTAWGIEHNADGWRADAYLYCVEVVCPETGWRVPLAPSWVIGEKSRCIAKLVPEPAAKRYRLDIVSGVTAEEMLAAKQGTVRDGMVVHPVLEEQHKSPATMRSVRLAGRGRDLFSRYHESGLRLWENDDLVPRPDDVFQERLYAIRWVETYVDANGKTKTRKHYRAPDDADLAREAKVLDLLLERFASWQAAGFLPTTVIEPGYNTDQPIRERGWTHWHHLFNPRQLLVLGLFVELTFNKAATPEEKVMSLLGVMKSADNNSKLSGWSPLMGKELVDHVFANQALNTLSNHGVRAVLHLESCYALDPKIAPVHGTSVVETADGRMLRTECDVWITDPPYADAVNYHELAEFFLGWTSGGIAKIFPDWSRGSRRPLAVTGSDENFRRSMVDCYRNLTAHMAEDGMQVVMFTHQDAGVWADLTLILWAAGLRVTAAWCIATETESALKKGNYVQGTVLLVLRKQTGEQTAFLDDVYPGVEAEVRAQLDAMLRIDDRERPNFGDTDYQLAAYAAALRVLTQYRRLEDIDVERELARGSRSRGEKSPVERVIEQAVRIACDHLVPRGFDSFHWKILTPAERFYLKGVELESHREFRSGAYQELARGFGLREYKNLLGSGDANETRLRTPVEFAKKLLTEDSADPFAGTLVRHTLFAIREVTLAEGSTAPGRQWLRTELADRYWQNRKTILEVLNYLARMEHTAERWKSDATSARLLAGAVENDHA